MPLSSSSGLDIDLVFSHVASSSSSSSAVPWIPPRSQWPLPGQDDANGEGDDDDGQDDWGPSTSASKSRWLTAMTSWTCQERSSSSGGRMAIAMADGSVHFFAQEHRPTPSRSTPNRARSPSPTPSIASTRSGFHPRTDSHAPPPFAGFSSHEGSSATSTQEHILSPTSPTSTNLASTAAWKPPSPEASRQRGFDALESRLESQYHSGSAVMATSSSATHSHHRDSSVVGSFMESLGLSKSTGHQHSHHASPARSRRESTSAEMSRTSSSRTTGATSSQLTPPAAGPSPSSSRRHSHARSSALIGSSSAMASLNAPSSSSAEDMKRSRSVSQATGSSSRRREDEVDRSAAASPPAAAPALLESARPYARLTPSGRDLSPVVAMAKCRLRSNQDGSPDTLLILHRSGYMTAVSLDYGTVLGDVDLTSTPLRSEQASHISGAAAGSTSSPSASNAGGNGGGGLVASTLAALRSHSNSPAPPHSTASTPAAAHAARLQQHQQQPTSRPGSASLLRRALTNEGGPQASGGAAQATRPQQDKRQGAVASFASMLQVVHSSEQAKPVAVCYDAAQKLLIFVSIELAPGNAASLRVVDAVYIADAGRDRPPSVVVVDHEPSGCYVAHLDEGRDAVVLQQYQTKNSAVAASKATTSKLALPDFLAGSAQACALLDPQRMLARTADETIVLLKITGKERLEVIKSIRIAGLEDVELVAGSREGEQYALARTSSSTRVLPIVDEDIALLEHDGSFDVATMLPCGPGTTLLTALAAEEDGLRIHSLDVTAAKPRKLFASHATTPPPIAGLLPLSMERILVLTSSGHLVMTSLNDLVAGAQQALANMPNNPPCSAAAAPNSRLALFRLITNPAPRASSSTANKYILTAFSTGSVAFWDPATLRLVAEWSLFATSPATNSLALFGNNDNTLRLHGCLALCSLDGSLALIALDGLKLLYLIPGRGTEAPLVRLAVRADELMLLYADGRARVWDVASMELRRSVSAEQAGAMLEDGRGGWSAFEMGSGAATETTHGGSAANGAQGGVMSSVAPYVASVGSAMMRANLKRAIDAAAKAAAGANGGGGAVTSSTTPTSSLARPRAVRPSASSATIGGSSSGGAARVQTILRPLMLALWPFGVDEEMDTTVQGLFEPPLSSPKKSSPTSMIGVALGSASASEGSNGDRRHYQGLPAGGAEEENDSLAVSGATNATRFLALVAMLDVLARASVLPGDGQNRLTTWLTTTLPSSVPTFAHLDPAVLALHLVDATPSIRSAATLLLSNRIASMEAQQVDALVEGPASWRALLPRSSSISSPASTAQPPRQVQAQALSLIGFLCLKRYAALDPSLLRDVAESVAWSLSSAAALEYAQQLRLIALHLCVEGFAIWQNYVDAMALLRALFALAVGEVGEGESAEVQTAARHAVVQVAEEHAPLFMTTLNLDLLAAAAAGHDSGSAGNVASASTSGAQQAMRTMRLLTFLVSQRPNLLLASLPRIAEAVVKALDPTISASPSSATTTGHGAGTSNASASASASPKSTSISLPSNPTPSTQRDVLLPTATQLISSLVRTYRTLAFHGATQRLAVGTHEGAIVMYELRTATRLFVLEGGHGHHGGQQRGAVGGGPGSGHGPHTAAAGPLTLLSFSPDGRRLISLSLAEGKALAWKVGSSLASWLLRPGGVPRQGGGGGSASSSGGSGGGTAGAEPAYKVWRFRPFVEEGEEAQVDVRCDWVADKRCEVEIVGGQRRERTLFDVE